MWNQNETIIKQEKSYQACLRPFNPIFEKIFNSCIQEYLNDIFKINPDQLNQNLVHWLLLSLV